MNKLEQAKAELKDLLVAINQHFQKGNWVELHEATKQAERVTFRIYMMTDTGE